VRALRALYNTGCARIKPATNVVEYRPQL